MRRCPAAPYNGCDELHQALDQSCGSARGRYPMRSPDVLVGERFAQALLAKDWTRVEGAVGPKIDFRALTPGRPWEAATRKALIEEVFQHWFGPSDGIYEILSISADRVAGR